MCPEKVNKCGEKGWKACPERSSWGLGASLLGEKETEEQPLCSWLLPKEGKQRGRCWSLLPGSQWKDVWECLRAHQAKCRLDIRMHYFTRGWSNAGTGFLEWWSMPQGWQHLKSVWTVPLQHAWTLGQPWTGQVGTSKSCWSLPAEIYSILFCSVLSCPVL